MAAGAFGVAMTFMMVFLSGALRPNMRAYARNGSASHAPPPKLTHGDVALTVRIPGSVSRTLHQALNLDKASNFVALIWNLPIVAPARL